MISYEWVYPATAAVVLLVLIGGYAIRFLRRARRKKYGLDSGDEAIFPNDVSMAIEAEETWLRTEHERLSLLILGLKKPAYEQMPPEEIVAAGAREERVALQEITGDASSEAVELVDSLRSIGSNSLAQLWRALSRPSHEISVAYGEILADACKHLGARPAEGGDIYTLEIQLQKQAFARMLQAMPTKDRERFLKEFSTRTAAPGLEKEAYVVGGIVVANLSGFGLYLASSTALGAITSAIGVTLPFAVYTGMSSTMAVLIGPVGWVALGAWVVHKLGKANPNKVVAGTLLIANIRQRLISDRDRFLPRIKNDRDVVLRNFHEDLGRLRAKLEQAKAYCSDSDMLSRNAYEMPIRPRLYGREEQHPSEIALPRDS